MLSGATLRSTMPAACTRSSASMIGSSSSPAARGLRRPRRVTYSSSVGPSSYSVTK